MKLTFPFLTRFISSHLMPVITVGVALSLMLVAAVSWNVWTMYGNFTNVVSAEFQLQRLSSSIVHLDEILTMSARMAAATGDLKWEERYRQFEPKLDAAIKQAIRLAPEAYKSHTAQTDAANIKLVEMENQAFDLVRQGKSAAALELLFSKEYESQKQIYVSGMDKTVTAIAQRIEPNLEGYRLRLFWSSLFSFISFPVLLLAWLAILSLVKWYIRQRKQAEMALQAAKIQLEQANETLEYRVKERTAQLAKANEEITNLNQKLKAENLRMSAELEVTRQLQKMLLPKEHELDQIAGLEIAGFMEPADEVGGDYYDVLTNNGAAKIGIGDVTGHGLESGVLMLMVQTAIRTLQESNETDPVRFMDVLNRTIYKNVSRMNTDKNLTLALLDYHQGQLNISGQHEEMVVVRSSGEVERVDTMDLGFPIGLDEEIADFIAQEQMQLHFGDVAVLYTDGITEAEDINRVQYGMERLCEVVKRYRQASATEIKEAVIRDLRQHIGAQKVFDDITLVVLKQK